MNVTVVLPVSRKDYLHQIFARFEAMPMFEQTNLLVWVDGPMDLYEVARNLTRESRFYERLCIYGKKHVVDVGSVRRRRERIAEIHNDIKTRLVDCDWVFSLEDDTLMPSTTFTTMQKWASYYPHAGIISGIELGRWGYPHIGAWNANDVFEPTEFISTPLSKGLQEVDATGLYCCMIRSDVYKEHTFKPFEKVLGPDVELGIWLRQQGYKNYIDNDIKCTHLTKIEPVEFNREIVQVRLKKEDNGKWSQGQL